MPHIKITIQEVGGEPVLKLSDEEIKSMRVGSLEQFNILERGMQSGKSIVSLLIKLPNGTHVLSETSADIFRGMAAALSGAEQRFLDKKS